MDKVELSIEELKYIVGKWIKALRSGSYAQGVGSLRTRENRFCCLGVLAEVLMKEQGELDLPYHLHWQQRDSMSNYSFAHETVTDSCSLTPQIRYLLRMEKKQADCSENPSWSLDRFIMLNDSLRKDFTRIADAIELAFEEKFRVKPVYSPTDET